MGTEAHLALPGKCPVHGNMHPSVGQKEAQHKDTESLCGSAGDGESGSGRFLIGLEVKLQEEKNTPALLWFKERGWGDRRKKPFKFL